MQDGSERPVGTIQDHESLRAGSHDFQADIENVLESEIVGTILDTVMFATGMRFSGVARVTQDRWVACRTADELGLGLDAGDEIAIESTFCQSVRDTGKTVAFSDVATDDEYANHPIAQQFGIVSYVSVPVYRPDGSFFGTLCGIDTEPRDVKNERTLAMFKMLAGVVGASLHTEERLRAMEESLDREREASKLQEEFVAILGHDLRNPVAAIGAGIRRLQKEDLSDQGQQVLRLMRSSRHRMQDLIENMMLHAKARLGGGFKIVARHDAPLERAIRHVVDEIQAAHPEHEIDLDISLQRAVSCDADRLAQVVSNLISNAIQHGREGAGIRVAARATGEELSISVTNTGAPIPAHVRDRLFLPFMRGEVTDGEGLGLGLYISSAIAEAHNGVIEIISRGQETTFTLRVPAIPLEEIV